MGGSSTSNTAGSGSNNSGSSSSYSGSSGSSSGNPSGSGGSSSDSSSGSWDSWLFESSVIVPYLKNNTVKLVRLGSHFIPFSELFQSTGFMKASAGGTNQPVVIYPTQYSITPNSIQPLCYYIGRNDVVETNGGTPIPYERLIFIGYSLSGTAIEGLDYKIHSPYFNNVAKQGILDDLFSPKTEWLEIMEWRNPQVSELTIEFDFNFIVFDTRPGIYVDLQELAYSGLIFGGSKQAESSFLYVSPSGKSILNRNEYRLETPDVISRNPIGLTASEIFYLEKILSGKGTTLTLFAPDIMPPGSSSSSSSSYNPPSNKPPQITSMPPLSHTIAIHGANLT